mgnify:CR=1 FL=1
MLGDNDKELLARAKSGCPAAQEELLGRKAKVWTEEELHALNTLLQNKTKVLNTHPEEYTSVTTLRRTFLSNEEVAVSDFITPITQDYYLVRYTYNKDGYTQHWVAKSIAGTLQPICCVDPWL